MKLSQDFSAKISWHNVCGKLLRQTYLDESISMQLSCSQILLMQWKKYKDAMYTYKENMQYILNFHILIRTKVTFGVLKNVGV